MEAAGAGGRRLPVGRVEASPERGRPTAYALSAGRPAPARPMRKVQIIYYLCRNGQLEHPHFMELAQHPHQPLRLKDVMDRLTLLRGKGMPALFSWSCKRNYKNGYVWNDLSENDVIYPSDGVEYVLKGSEIFPGCSSSSDRFQHLRVTDRSPTKALALPHMSHKQYSVDSYRDDTAEDREDDDELGYSYHHRRTASGRLVAARPDNKAAAVSARATNRARPVELPVEETSPPSSTSSDKPPQQQQQQPGRRGASSELQDPEPSRTGSMLLQLIACGSTLPAAAGGGGPGKCRAEPRRSCGLVSRLSARGGADEDEDEEDEVAAAEAAGADLSRRFGHLAVEDKAYFSGSIVEGGGGRGTPLPASSLKRSNSYNEERSCRPGAGATGENTMDEQMEGDGGIRGRCIPGRKKTPPPPPPQK